MPGHAAQRLDVALDQLHRRVEDLHDRSRGRPARRSLRGTSSRCRRRGAPARRSAPSTGSRAACRRCASTADPCGRCSCRPGTRASSAAAAVAASPGACAAAASPPAAPPPPPAAPPPPRPPRGRPRRDRHGERRRRARDLDRLLLQHAQQLGLRAEARIVRREHVGRRALRPSASGSSACSCRRSCAGSRCGCWRSG